MPISLTLERPLETKLNKIAKMAGKTPEYIISKSIADNIAEIEYANELRKEVEDYEAGRIKGYTLDELGQSLGL